MLSQDGPDAPEGQGRTAARRAMRGGRPVETGSGMHNMQVRAVMSRPLRSVAPQDSLETAAAMMRRHAIGALAVLAGGRAVGIVTDRDILLGMLADAEAGERAGMRPVSAAMSADPVTCHAGQDVAEAAALMGDGQIRRLLVLDGAGAPAGIVSLGDIAVHASEELAGQALGEICEARAAGRRPARFRPPG